jgi:putative transposase
MAIRRDPFAIGEWYHCYNRGIDKRIVFADEHDAHRFLMVLFLANSDTPVNLYSLRRPRLEEVLEGERSNPIVGIGAFCLMPNHFHLLLREITEHGISSFMQKVGTAYTMYFNEKNARVGGLFVKPFRSRHVTDDRYFQKVLQYIHLNPAELYEPGWKSGRVRSIKSLKKKLLAYPFSSLKDYEPGAGNSRLLTREGFEVAHVISVPRMLTDAREYYAALAKDDFEMR